MKDNDLIITPPHHFYYNRYITSSVDIVQQKSRTIKFTLGPNYKGNILMSSTPPGYVFNVSTFIPTYIDKASLIKIGEEIRYYNILPISYIINDTNVWPYQKTTIAGEKFYLYFLSDDVLYQKDGKQAIESYLCEYTFPEELPDKLEIDLTKYVNCIWLSIQLSDKKINPETILGYLTLHYEDYTSGIYSNRLVFLQKKYTDFLFFNENSDNWSKGFYWLELNAENNQVARGESSFNLAEDLPSMWEHKENVAQISMTKD